MPDISSYSDDDLQAIAGQSPNASISNAILGQESGANPNIGSSVDGAVGMAQIEPATFAQYAQPGESINNPADNLAVHNRIIQDLSNKSGGDPARIAVGYFSGPGNIAPAGSPTPWKHDRADGNGKTVSSYVSDVLGRMGNAVVPSAQAAEMPSPDMAHLSDDQLQQIAGSSQSAPIDPVRVAATAFYGQDYDPGAVQSEQLPPIQASAPSASDMYNNALGAMINGDSSSPLANLVGYGAKASEGLGLKQVGSALAAAAGYGQGDTFGDRYTNLMQAQAAMRNATDIVNPTAGKIGKYSGMLANMGLTGAAAELAAPAQGSALANFAVSNPKTVGALTGALFGGGYGATQGDDAQSSAKDALSGALTGGLFGAALPVISNVASPAISALARYIRPATIGDMAGTAANDAAGLASASADAIPYETDISKIDPNTPLMQYADVAPGRDAPVDPNIATKVSALQSLNQRIEQLKATGSTDPAGQAHIDQLSAMADHIRDDLLGPAPDMNTRGPAAFADSANVPPQANNNSAAPSTSSVSSSPSATAQPSAAPSTPASPTASGFKPSKLTKGQLQGIDVLKQALKDENIDPSQVADSLQTALASGKPVTALDVATSENGGVVTQGRNLINLTKAAATFPGDAATLSGQVASRGATASERIAGDFDKAVSSNPFYRVRDQAAQQQKLAGPFYKQAYEANQNIASPKIDRILATPAGQTALKGAVDEMQNQMSLAGNPDPELTAMAKEAGMRAEGGVASGLKLQTLDYVKRELDAQANAAAKAANSGNGNTAAAKRIANLSKGLREELDRLDTTPNGAYAAARSNSAQGFQLTDALEQGRSFATQDPEEIKAFMADPNTSQPQKAAYLAGVRRAVQDTADNKNAGANPILALTKPAIQKRLAAAIGDTDKVSDLNSRLSLESIMNRINQVHTGGSDTMIKSNFGDQIGKTSVLDPLKVGKFVASPRKAAFNALEGVLKGKAQKIGTDAAGQIMKYMTTADPAIWRALK